jgi:hypothetical protein
MKTLLFALGLSFSFASTGQAADAIHEVVKSECFVFPDVPDSSSLQYVDPVTGSDEDVYGDGWHYFKLDYLYKVKQQILLIIASDGSPVQQIETEKLINKMAAFTASELVNPMGTALDREASWDSIKEELDWFRRNRREAACE